MLQHNLLSNIVRQKNEGDENMDFKIRKVETHEIETLRRVSIETFHETYAEDYDQKLFQDYYQDEMSHAQLLKELENPQSVFYFVLYQEEIAGYFKINIGEAQTEPFGVDYAELQRIYLYASFQRMKLGQYMFEQVKQIAKQLHKTYLWLGVWSENHAAIAFYEKQGLMKIGEHEFKMGDHVDIDWTMALKL